MNELELKKKSDEDFIFSLEDARHVFSLLRRPEAWELVWIKDAAAPVSPPPHSVNVGYDPTWFWGDHFSAICDSMCFPRWHGPDPEGRLFAPYFERLNEHALFSTFSKADEFLRFYRSHDWTETGDYLIAKVRLLLGDA
jgi:hypothetical protein